MYFNTAEKKIKVYSNTAWDDLGGGWDGIIPNYTTAQRNALFLTDGLIVYNTTETAVQIYKSDAWANIGAKLSLAAVCSSDGDCDSTHCMDGVCCKTSCAGVCEACNLTGTIGTCTAHADGTDPEGGCTGNCDICSSGICAADATKCTGNCDVCSGSATTYNCAASDSLCSNTTGSCYCSGSGTVFNCQACSDDPYGVCGHPICSNYTCDQMFDNGEDCATCKICSGGSCIVDVANGVQGLNCTTTHYRCNGDGSCTKPCGRVVCLWYQGMLVGGSAPTCTQHCAAADTCSCIGMYLAGTCVTSYQNCAWNVTASTASCKCDGYLYD